MQSLSYSSLNDQQRAQVAYLFADCIFGTDAGAFVYEVNKSGEVTGRVSTNSAAPTRAKQKSTMNMAVMPEVNVNERMMSNAHMHMDALAASIAQTIYQQQFEEVQQ